MNITIFGAGYVGLVTGACFSFTNKIIFVENNLEKLELLTKGCCPIYEPNLSNYLLENKSSIYYTSNIQMGVESSDVIFLCLPTPSSKNGDADISSLTYSCERIAKLLGETKKTIVVKSTVPVGTCINLKALIKEINPKANFDIVFNPEFLKEGSAIEDFIYPDRIIIGAENNESFEIVNSIYENMRVGFSNKYYKKNDNCFGSIIQMNIADAELVKIAANTFLPMKLSFVNMLSRVCTATGTNIFNVLLGVCSDKRIGYDFMRQSSAYGGSCFDKDISSFYNLLKKIGIMGTLVKGIMDINVTQPYYCYKLINDYFYPHNKKTYISVFGLGFKNKTDDVRNTPAQPLIDKLIDSGNYNICAMDYFADENFKLLNPTYRDKIYFTLKTEEVLEADALVMLYYNEDFIDTLFDLQDKFKKDFVIFNFTGVKNEELEKYCKVVYI